MKTLEEIKEFAIKSCKNNKYTYKNETIPFMHGYYEGFQKAVEELNKEKNDKKRSN